MSVRDGNASRSLGVRAFSSSRAWAAYATDAAFGWFDGNGAHTLDLPAELRARAVAVALNRNGKPAVMEATCRLWEYDSLLAQWQMQQLQGSDAAPLNDCSGFAWSGDWLAVQGPTSVRFIAGGTVRAVVAGVLRGAMPDGQFSVIQNNGPGLYSIETFPDESGNPIYLAFGISLSNAGRDVIDAVDGGLYYRLTDHSATYYMDAIAAPSTAARGFVSPHGRRYLYGPQGVWQLADFLSSNVLTDVGVYIAAGVDSNGAVLSVLQDYWSTAYKLFNRSDDLSDFKGLAARQGVGWAAASAPNSSEPQLWRYQIFDTANARVRELPTATATWFVSADVAGRVFALARDAQGDFVALSIAHGQPFTPVYAPNGCTLVHAASNGIDLLAIGRCGPTYKLWRVGGQFAELYSSSDVLQRVAVVASGTIFVATPAKLMRIIDGTVTKTWDVATRQLTASNRECYFLYDGQAAVADVSQIWRVEGDAISPVRVARGTLQRMFFLIGQPNGVTALGSAETGAIHRPASLASVHETPLVP